MDTTCHDEVKRRRNAHGAKAAVAATPLYADFWRGRPIFGLKNRFAFPVILYYHGHHAGPKGK